MTMSRKADAVVVGGGLAGLTAAALLARSGRRTLVFERSESLGGRARTTTRDGFQLNLGPHAWYVGGPGTAILDDLDVPLKGHRPKPAANFAIVGGRLHALPIGFVSLVTTDLLGVAGKIETARTLASVAAMDTSAYDGITVSEWLASMNDDRARGVVHMLMRIAAYANAPRLLSAGAALYSLQSVLRKGVRYLDGGWQQIVQALDVRARALGAVIESASPVAEVLHDGRRVEGVRLDSGEVVQAADVILAVDPATVGRLLPGLDALRRWHFVPSRAATLDIALRTYPNPSVIAAFGVEAPLYFSVHSASASLAPEGGAVLHAAKYLEAEAPVDPRRDEAELEAIVDMLQPGWRDEVVLRRFLPSLTVAHAIPTAAGNGLRSRPGVDALQLHGAWLAGDWAGSQGMLANAAVASAARAAQGVIGREQRVPEEAVA